MRQIRTISTAMSQPRRYGKHTTAQHHRTTRSRRRTRTATKRCLDLLTASTKSQMLWSTTGHRLRLSMELSVSSFCLPA